MKNNDLIKTQGLIDRHIHGGYGVNFNTCNENQVIDLCKKLSRHGVVGIFPTVMTDSIENIKKQIRIIKNAKEKLSKKYTQILGLHLEGPFLNIEKRGIHNSGFLLRPNIENFKEIEDSEIKIVTLAPELDDNYELTNYLRSKNITVSAGHSKASPEETAKVGQVTHIFNAMSTLSHRNPNILSEALINNNIAAEIIADGVHINKDILKLFFNQKPKDKVLLISDALPIAYFEGSKVIFADEEIFLKDGKAVDKNGTMAGSSVYLDDIIRFLVKENISTFEDCIKFASENILTSLKLPQSKDYVVWDNELKVKEVCINGFLTQY